MKLAFLGLGVMGGPMAEHLAEAGHALAVWNRTRARAEAWAQARADRPGVRVADSPAAAAAGAEAVFLCLGDDPDVEAVAAALRPGLAPGAVLVDHSTASPDLARRLAEALAADGVGWVDAPVSGGQAGAEAGRLSVMCGGREADVDRARPAIGAYAARIVHIGPAGHGQLAKAVNQICIAGLVEALAEGLHFAERAGLDLDRVLGAVGGGAAQSWQMDNRARTMIEDRFDFGFAVDWMRKDLRIALEEARANGAQLPVAALVDRFYADVQAMGGGRWDTSSLIRRLSALSQDATAESAPPRATEESRN